MKGFPSISHLAASSGSLSVRNGWFKNPNTPSLKGETRRFPVPPRHVEGMGVVLDMVLLFFFFGFRFQPPLGPFPINLKTSIDRLEKTQRLFFCCWLVLASQNSCKKYVRSHAKSCWKNPSAVPSGQVERDFIQTSHAGVLKLHMSAFFAFFWGEATPMILGNMITGGPQEKPWPFPSPQAPNSPVPK